MFIDKVRLNQDILQEPRELIKCFIFAAHFSSIIT